MQNPLSTTHWSVVRRAAAKSIPDAKTAMANLYEKYRPALVLYALRSGFAFDEAEDFVQSFFTRLLSKQCLETADPDRGRFRTFLLTSFKNHIANETARSCAQKRGGGTLHVSLDDQTMGASVAGPKSAKKVTPAQAYEMKMASLLIQATVDKLRKLNRNPEKQQLYSLLENHLTDDSAAKSYREIARELDMTEGSVRLAAFRLRLQFRHHLRQEILAIVSDPEQVDDELRYLVGLFS